MGNFKIDISEHGQIKKLNWKIERPDLMKKKKELDLFRLTIWRLREDILQMYLWGWKELCWLKTIPLQDQMAINWLWINVDWELDVYLKNAILELSSKQSNEGCGGGGEPDNFKSKINKFMESVV